VPLSRGGTSDDANLRAAHYGCNSRRGNRLTVGGS
jgi:5-methylcytosine-specific restriction endonuclease McrA